MDSSNIHMEQQFSLPRQYRSCQFSHARAVCCNGRDAFFTFRARLLAFIIPVLYNCIFIFKSYHFLGAAVLRIPILYGEIETLEESAVTVLFDKVQFSNKSANMDHWQQRFPTYVKDVASICQQLAEKRMLVSLKWTCLGLDFNDFFHACIDWHVKRVYVTDYQCLH